MTELERNWVYDKICMQFRCVFFCVFRCLFYKIALYTGMYYNKILLYFSSIILDVLSLDILHQFLNILKLVSVSVDKLSL